MTFRFRTWRLALGTLAFAAAALSWPADALAQGEILSQENVLRDPEIPSLGNPDGDVTIVEYFDYHCSYCKAVAPELAKLAKEDGKIRIVLKDWPILGKDSSNAARMALAAKYQGKYQQAHDTLISARGRLTLERIEQLLAGAGIDVTRLKQDLLANRKSIEALLERNNAQAEAFGFQASPSFIVGTYRYPGAAPVEHLKQMVADVRAGKNK